MKDKEHILYKIEHVSKIFGNRYVLNDISFNINCGDICGIIGTSGSGKSTLLNLLIGFLKPEKGKISFRDLHLININNDNSFLSVEKYQNVLKKMYGFAAQNPSFYPNLTVKENLRYFGSLYNLSKESIKLNSNNLLELTGLKQSQHIIASSLSGGMQRRLDIACSLIHDPKILILDEPTADLDPLLAEQIWNLLRIINQRGTTIILSSHHLMQLENFCNKIAIIKDNKIIAFGKPEEIKKKNIQEEKIALQSSPGNYKQIITELKKLKLKNIKNYAVENNNLIIETNNPGTIMSNLMRITTTLGEDILNIEIIKPKLEQVFINISKEKNKKQEESSTEENFENKKLKHHKKHHHKKHHHKK